MHRVRNWAPIILIQANAFIPRLISTSLVFGNGTLQTCQKHFVFYTGKTLSRKEGSLQTVNNGHSPLLMAHSVGPGNSAPSTTDDAQEDS